MQTLRDFKQKFCCCCCRRKPDAAAQAAAEAEDENVAKMSDVEKEALLDGYDPFEDYLEMRTL